MPIYVPDRCISFLKKVSLTELIVDQWLQLIYSCKKSKTLKIHRVYRGFFVGLIVHDKKVYRPTA